MEDFSEITDLETARHVLIGYDKAFREHAEIHTEMEAKIERLRKALKKIANDELPYVAEYGYNRIKDIARAALKEDDK